jgi:phosphosulfolactate phosphohydrolase-like enzyme
MLLTMWCILQVMSLAHRHIVKLGNKSDVQYCLEMATMQLATISQSQPHNNLPPSFGSQREECDSAE